MNLKKDKKIRKTQSLGSNDNDNNKCDKLIILSKLKSKVIQLHLRLKIVYIRNIITWELRGGR